MTKFVVGDQVRVYDGDAEAWLLGEVIKTDQDGITVSMRVRSVPLIMHIPGADGLEMLIKQVET